MKTINFTNGDFIINEESISFHVKGGNAFENNNTILRENIGVVDIQQMKILTKSPISYCFIFVILGVILTIIGIFGNVVFSIFGITFILFGMFCFGAYTWLDVAMGIPFINKLFIKIFGIEVKKIVVQNCFGGTNMHFLVLINEFEKLPKIEDFKIEKSKINTTPNQLEDIEVLAKLRDKGIITNDEFEFKKKQILNL